VSQTLIQLLSNAFRPELFGEDRSAFTARIQGYVTQATQKTTLNPTDSDAKIATQEAWARFRAYSDAYDYTLSLPQDTAVDSEGSVNMGDKAALLRELRRARDEWKTTFDALMAVPEASGPKPGDGLGTMSVRVETVF
jgi:hypothetical protein